MSEYDNYIDSIIKNLDSVNNIDLKIQILRLIEERNQLLEIVKKDTLTGAYNRRILNNINSFICFGFHIILNILIKFFISY